MTQAPDAEVQAEWEAQLSKATRSSPEGLSELTTEQLWQRCVRSGARKAGADRAALEAALRTSGAVA